MQISAAHETMMIRRVVFCVFVSKVGATRFPLDKQLVLAGIIFDLVEMHVDCLG